MTFNEMLCKIGEEVKEIEVCACGAYNDINGKYIPCIGIRTGSAPAGVDFHDPVIDGWPIMICGDIFTINGDEVNDIRIFENSKDCEPMLVHLRGVYNIIPKVGVHFDFGIYDILSYEIVKWDTFATECCVKLTLKRRGS